MTLSGVRLASNQTRGGDWTGGQFVPNGQGNWRRPPGLAAGRMDLLTVVLHEMGHLAGRRDVSTAGHPNALMDATLAPGLRRADALDAVFAGGFG